MAANTTSTREPGSAPRPGRKGFTLLEMLAVLAIIGLVAALAMPVMRNFRPNYTASAMRQLLDDLGYARQLAISQRTTVLMVFVRPSFWTDPATNGWRVPPAQLAANWSAAANLFEKQMVGYAMVSLRSAGDQPGKHTARYLTPWRTLPEGAYIAWQKFVPGTAVLPIYTNSAALNPVPMLAYQVDGFDLTSAVPFPLIDTGVYRPPQPYVTLPYIAFDYLGRRCDANGKVISRDAVIPLTRGSIGFGHDPASKTPRAAPPTLNEDPPGNTTNAFNLVYVDWLTGRARGVQQEVR
jgi:prepilin-type N-terminal cleavage/methylation domain-containing protein